MRKFLNKIKCFFGFHSWCYDPLLSYYSLFSDSIYQNTIDAVCNHCDKRKTIIK